MAEYVFYDDDVQTIENQAYLGNADVYQITLKDGIEAVNLHKDDVIHLAKLFGLIVFEQDSVL